MPTIASLLVKVGAETGGAEAGLGRIGGLLRGGLVAAAAAGAAAVVGVGIASVKMAGDFQAGMTTLVTGAGESRNQIGMVSDGILKMATDTGTTTQQLTAGMFMIESAGYHGAAGLNVLKSAAEGAKVGNADLGVTSDALTTILKDYPKVTNGAAGAMNSLIATVASGKTHMQDLAGAMAQILPTASAAGVGLNDVMGAMATMTGEGVPAANAATYLRQTIIALDAPSKQTSKALASVGLSSTDVANEMQKSLPDTLKMITDAVGKKFPAGSAEYVAALKNIAGGSKQMQGILDLTGGHMADFASNVKGVADQVKKGGQAIVGWGDVQGDFNFKMDKAKEVVQTLMIKLGTGLLPIVGQVVDFFSARAVPVLDGLGKAFSGTGGIIGKDVVPMLAQLATWVQKQVVPALMGLYTTFQTQVMPAVTKFADYAIKNIIPVLEKLATWVLTKVVPAAQQLEVWFLNHVLPVLEQVWGVISADVIPAFEGIANAVMGQLVPSIEKLWNKLSPVLLPVLQTVGDVLKNVVGPAIQGIIGIVSNLVDMISTVIGKIGDFMNAVGGLKNAAGNAMGGVGNFLGGVGNFFSGHAAGGDITRNEIAWVGEKGPELVALPGGSHVYPNGTSPANNGGAIRGLPAGMSSGGASGTVNGQPVQINLQMEARTIARLLLPDIAYLLRTEAAVRHM